MAVVNFQYDVLNLYAMCCARARKLINCERSNFIITAFINVGFQWNKCLTFKLQSKRMYRVSVLTLMLTY